MKNIIKLHLLIVIALCSCNDPYENTTYQAYEVNPVSSYLESRPDDFSGWIEVLKYADLYNALNQASESFTVFVPDNDAVQAFYKRKNVSSIQELGQEYARDLVRYHIIGDSIGLGDFIAGGKIETRTISDDYLTVTFDEESETGGGFNSVYINNEARVTELAIMVSNGYVYVMDAVLSPLVETVYERIDEAGGYTIFAEALEMTSWKDSLNIIYDQIKMSNGTTRTQKRDYTVLAVPDYVFRNEGITSTSALISLLEAGNDYTNTENELFSYMAYHIIKGNYSLFEFYTIKGSTKKKMWDTMTDAVVEISLEEDGHNYLNYGGGDVKAQFVEKASDVQAKNGMLHQIDGYLPIWQSIIPTEVIFDFGDYPEVAAYISANGGGQIYQTGQASEYQTFVGDLSCYTYELGPSGTKTPTSSWHYVAYATPKTGSAWMNCLNCDHFYLNLGTNGWISMQTPTVIAGKYKITLYFTYATSMSFMRTGNGGKMQVSFDGENKKDIAPYLSVPANTLGCYSSVIYDELEFAKTGTHTFKIVVTDPLASSNDKFRIQLDYLLFEPIIEE